MILAGTTIRVATTPDELRELAAKLEKSKEEVEESDNNHHNMVSESKLIGRGWIDFYWTFK